MTVHTWRDHAAAQWEAGAAVPSWVWDQAADPGPAPDVTGGAIAWLAAHLTLTAAVAAGLAAVLLLAGLRRAAR